MYSKLTEMIYKRKSVRHYEKAAVSGDLISKTDSFIGNIKPLYPEIKVTYEILSRDSISCFLPWKTEQAVAIYTESREKALENVGFMFQQLDLYLQWAGHGSCWLGMGKPKAPVKTKDGLQFAIMLAFGYPKGDAVRTDISEFKRKKLSEISDIEDTRLEPARLAPSSVNSQPWYFTHEGDMIHAYRKNGSFIADMNRVDMGIALAHMYVANNSTFKFVKSDAEKLKGYEYTGSFTL